MGNVATPRSRWERRQRIIVIAASSICAVLVVCAAALLYGLISGSSASETRRILAIAAPSVAILAGLIGIAAKITAPLRWLRERLDRSRLVHPQLIHDDRLVDRTTEMGEIAAALGASSVINCWGAKGAGKSFLLKHLSDVVNGYRDANPAHPGAIDTSAALYFDLAEAIGFVGIETRVCRQVLHKENGTWDEFVRYVGKKFPRQRVLLILDNANTPALWPAVGSAAYSYLTQRPADLLVFGSVQRMALNNITPKPVTISGLKLPFTMELVASKGVDISPEEVKGLHEQFNGLPYYTGLFATHGGGAPGTHQAPELETALDTDLIPTLSAMTRRLLAYGALFATVSRQISIKDLEHCSLPSLNAQLRADEGLLTPLADHGRRFGMHDVLRDSVLRTVDPEVRDAAAHLFGVARREGRLVEAAVFAMFADPDAIGEDAFDAVLGRVIRNAVESRDYAVLDNLHSRSTHTARMREFIAEEQDRHQLFRWGHATQLAGLGQYERAEEELLSTGIAHTAGALAGDASSELDPQIRFLLADVAHLQNRYDDAAQMFLELGEWASSVGDDPKLHARCTWGRAHVLRHQGKDLDGALDLFERAAGLGRSAHELFAQSYSITGATGIKIFLGQIPGTEEGRLLDIETQVFAAGRKGYLLEVWKSQAQVAWQQGDRQRAFTIVDDAVGGALEQNDRLLYNLYFEKGEFLRLSGRPEDGLEHYRDVLKFGEGNGDRNLISNALLGTVLADMTGNGWRYHGSAERAHDACLRAQRVASDADIQITRQIAERIASAAAGDIEITPDQQRLILF
jgi:tetratricopeptide (TPR) repeat protein